MSPVVLACAVALCSAATAHAQLTIRVTTGAGITPSDATVYVAGSFNGWNPAAPGYALRRDAHGFAITLPDSVRGPVEFKFTLGSWDRVELDARGGDVENRSYTIGTGPAVYLAEVGGWRAGPQAPRASTARPTVSIVNEHFAMPQLGKTRRVWLYLPPDYHTTNKRYPVLYMHDGQNVFDAATSYAGEWGMDEALDSLHQAGDYGVIVVAVDHGGQDRVPEYSPWPTRYGSAQGDAYVEFLVKTLKPWVDQNYRTRTDRLNTAIAGSSMGGLISLYAALKYPDVFARAGVFSPALWIAPAAFDFVKQQRRAAGARFYFMSGALEVAAGEQSGVYLRDQDRMVETLTRNGYRPGRDIVANIAPDGKHAEWFWRREFPAAYLWLFRESKEK